MGVTVFANIWTFGNVKTAFAGGGLSVAKAAHNRNEAQSAIDKIARLGGSTLSHPPCLQILTKIRALIVN